MVIIYMQLRALQKIVQYGIVSISLLFCFFS